ncbi:hypothetical protein CRX67_04805 [Enterobacteriaceae bacterium A-F18]|nr:hypothetical protein CRX67_04805 [Enterobacteriaceae bacterium A-F18]
MEAGPGAGPAFSVPCLDIRKSVSGSEQNGREMQSIRHVSTTPNDKDKIPYPLRALSQHNKWDVVKVAGER